MREPAPNSKLLSDRNTPDEATAARLRQACRLWATRIAHATAFSTLPFLAAWWLGLSSLATLYSGFPPVRPGGALCVLACSLALSVQSRAPSSKWVWICAAIGSLVAFGGLLEWVPDGSIKITQAAFHSFLGAPLSVDPRTPIVAGLCYLLEALGIALIGLKGPIRSVVRVAVGVAGVASIALVIGEANGSDSMDRLAPFAHLSLMSPFWIGALAVSFFLMTPEEGIGSLVASPYYGGHLARRLLPLATLVPVVFSFARSLNRQLNLLPAEFLAILLSTSFIVLMSAIVLVNARRLNLLDRDRRKVARRNETIAAVVESSIDAIISIGLDGGIQSWNQGAEAMFGYPAAEAVGKNIEMVVPADRSHEIEGMILRVMQGETLSNIETVRRRADGSLIDVTVTVAPIRESAGQTVGCSAIVRDLTNLRDYERRFRTVVESAPVAMIVVDQSGRILLLNELTRSLFGYTPAELVGKSVDALVPDRFSAGHGPLRTGYFSRPEARQMGVGRDLFALRKDGSEFAVEIGLNPIETPEGTLTLAAVVDITERKKASEALEAYAQELKRSNSELEQFAYVASHDLQEPLRMVVSYMELLKARYEGSLDERADKYIHYAVDGARRMQRLVQDLLTVSRVSSQAKPLVPTSSEAVLQWVLRGLSQAVREADATVNHDPLPMVLADEVQLGQVFQNLLSNAIKFRSESAPVVHVSAEPDGNMWRFSVRDNGIGIEPEYHEKIFQMFQRLHERGKYEGSGIGLPVSKKIVERHGGVLTLVSDAGSGSTFSFTLPMVEDSKP